MIEQGVVDASEAVAHAAFQDNDVAGPVYVEDGHAVDRTRWIVTRGRIHDVIGPDHQHDVGLRELAIHLVHLQQLIVRNVRFGEQDVHMAWHAAGDRMNRVFHIDAAALEIRRQLAHGVLRLGYRQTEHEGVPC